MDVRMETWKFEFGAPMELWHGRQVKDSAPSKAGCLRPANLRIWVVHYTPFTERRAHMEALLREHGLDGFPVTWVLQHDREELLEAWQRGEWGDPSQIAASSVSLILKHLEVYRQVARMPECLHLILEDDVLIPRPGVLADLEHCLKELPEDWELLFIGEGCHLHVPWWRRRPGKKVYFRGWKPWWRAGGGTSRCTEPLNRGRRTLISNTMLAGGTVSRMPPFHKVWAGASRARARSFRRRWRSGGRGRGGR
jgi:hypothetical protein